LSKKTSRSAARRGRPRSIDAFSDIEPREEILRKAARLFAVNRGVSSTSLTDVAAEVGVTVPALYYHFENLNAIAEELVGSMAPAFQVVENDKNASPSERLQSLLEQHIAQLTAGPYDLSFVQYLSEEETQRFGILHLGLKWRSRVASVIKAGIKTGELDQMDIELAVAVIVGLIAGSMQLRHVKGDVDPAKVTELVMRALAAPS
jgi:TetR/AcrR family transcriptional regulator, cholesterol catabolism regulator